MPAHRGDEQPRADVGVFGGSGLYSFLDGTEQVTVETAWGDPSAPVSIGELAGLRVAFLPRHGVGHRLPPHRVDYRANVAVMRELGVRALFAPFAAGSLQAHLHPGDFVVVDQLVDRTTGRIDTFHDQFVDGPQHVSLADPYDERLRGVLVEAGRAEGLTVHERGTVTVINGPRFSTRAESQWFTQMGWDLVNMTQYPEAALAREAGIAFAGLALVTDYDAGLASRPDIAPVSQEHVFERFEANVERLRALLGRAISRLARPLDEPTTPRSTASRRPRRSSVR